MKLWGTLFQPCDSRGRESRTLFFVSVTITGVAQPIVTPAVAVTGGKAMMMDLEPLNLNGERTFRVRARNAYGQSAESEPFTAWVGPPSVPTNFRVIAVE